MKVFRKVLLVCIACAFLLGQARAEDWPRFRGPDGDGIFSEKGLLKSWPKEGPKLLWSVDGLGQGYASVSVVRGRVFTTGMSDKKGYVFCFDGNNNGKLLWKTEYGPEWTGGYKGSRTTPTCDGKNVYIMSGHGLAAAFAGKDGSKLWEVDTEKQYGAKNIKWGISESPLLVDEKVIVTPGGSGAAVVALDPKNGNEVWAMKDVNQNSAYCSPIAVKHGGRTMIITMLAKCGLGIDSETGKMIWQQDKDTSYDVHAVSPVYHDGMVFMTSGYGSGSMVVELNKNGTSEKLLWKGGKENKIDCHHGGVLFNQGTVIGTGHKYTKGWACIEMKTGDVKWEERFVGKGSGILVDGLLIGYGERGDVGLAKVSPEKLEETGRFKVTKGSGEHWAHPAVSDGVLYIRHGDALMAYDVSGKQ